MRKRNASLSLTPDNRAVFRRDPAAQALLEILDIDHPALIGAAADLWRMKQLYGVEITPEVARRVAEAHKRRFVEPMATAADVTPAEGEVVYYVRLGNRVKIGTTTNLKNRLAALMPEEVLATEPGGVAQERLRHQQFGHLRTVGEWFRYEEDLMEHIASMSEESK